MTNHESVTSELSENPIEKLPRKLNAKYPDKWRKHSKINSFMDKTRFIAFKTPLASRFFVNKIPEDAFHISDVVQQVKSLNKILGLVIDLTDTDRYYDPAEWTARGVEYIKLPYSGHEIHEESTLMQDFKKVVDDFFAQNSDPDTLIGVHCTHGVNRTGYLICRYLIECHNWTADEALAVFNESRGEPIQREAYIDHLKIVENLMTSKISTDTVQKLLAAAEQVSHKAYCPYSKYKVGAAILVHDTAGQEVIITGCNVENASYGGTICAERTAVCKAVSEGYTKFEAIAVVTHGDLNGSPCGLCRQFMVEFGDFPVYAQTTANRSDIRSHTTFEILPFHFGPKDLPDIVGNVGQK